MQISLHRQNGVPPVYRQIADQIREQISAGHLDTGDRLPPIRALALQLGVNRDTVALAYDELVGEGALESTVGRGTFVAGQAARPKRGSVTAPPLSPVVEGLLEFERTRPSYGAAPDRVPFHALVPEPALYPVVAFRRSVNRVLEKAGEDVLGYGDRQGHLGLRRLLAERFAAHGIQAGPEAITLCQGASQGISLALRLFAEPGDCVAVEEPTYANVLVALRSLGLRAVPVPRDAQGPDLATLERVLARPEVKLFYAIPTFHNPMGTTMSLPARRSLLAVAAQTGKPVVEDAYEMDLRFRGRAVAPLAALDDRGAVVHLHSFSKSLFPGARVGAVTAQGRAVEGLHALRGASDLGGSPLLQAALADFLACGAYERHLVRVRKILRSRIATLMEVLAAEMPEDVRFTSPDGGYQVWVELPVGVDTRELLADAMSAGVLFAPGYVFLHDGRPSNGLRLSVAQTDEARIRHGISVLARVLKERLRAGPRAAEAGVQL